VSASLPKLAVISIYLGIFQDRVSRWCCWAVGLVLCVGPAVSVPMLAFQCRPVAYLHDKTIPGGRCWNQALMFRYGSIPNIVTDVVMLILPMPLIWGLHVSFKVKIGLLFTFLLGSMWVLQKLLRFVAFFTPLVDGTWTAVPLLCWGIVEPSIYLLAACLLCLRPLLRSLVKDNGSFQAVRRLWSSYGATRHAHTPYIEGPDRDAIRLTSDAENPSKNASTLA
jgi:hypothetical protein